MPMTNDFFLLPLTQQCRVLYAEGEFIMAIRYYGFKINLYRLGNRLVEVFYNHKLDKVETVQPLDRGSTRMNFYADQVSINPCYSHKP